MSESAPRTNTRQFCARCRSVDRVGFMAPKDLWRLVAGPRWEHDILCLACFGEIGDEKGVEWDVPELEFYPVSYVTLRRIRESSVWPSPEHDDAPDLTWEGESVDVARLREALDADRCQPHGENSLLMDRHLHNLMWNATSRFADILEASA